MSPQTGGLPANQALILEEVPTVRAEILYKIGVVHRVTVAVVVAPTFALPLFAGLVSQIVDTDAPVSGVNAADSVAQGVQSVLLVVFLIVLLAIPIVLLWAEWFCLSQIGSILRAGAWLRQVEALFGVSEDPGVIGWETWVDTRRQWDDNSESPIRLSVIFMYFVASAVLAGVVVQMAVAPMSAKMFHGGAPAVDSAPAFYFTILTYAIVFGAFLTARRRRHSRIMASASRKDSQDEAREE